MFSNCSQLTSLNLSSFDTSSVTNMNNMFKNCKNLISLDLSNFVLSKVNTMSSMFSGCSQLTSLDLSNFIIPNVNMMSSMFSGCSQLTSLNLSNFETIFVEVMDNMFDGCNSLEYLDISNFDFTYLDTSGKIFNGIGNIKYIRLFNVINMRKLSNEDFANLNKINDLIVCQNENIINSSQAIYCCCDFSKNPLNCDCNNYMTVKYKDKVEYTKGFINDGIANRNEISFIINQDLLFRKNETFIIEANNSIDIYFKKSITGLQSFFSVDFDINSKNITYVDFTHFNSSLLTNIYQMFQGCISIKEINFTNFQTSSIKIMAQMFSGCSQLTSLNLSNFDTSSVSNMREMFRDCTSLEYLDISYFDTGLLGSFSNMFIGANNIKYINLYNAKNITALTEAISKSSNLNTKNDLTVCQKEDIVNNTNALYACCDYWDYNFETLCCDPDNYIIVKFKEDISYPYGFSFVEYDQSQNEYRSEIYLIIKDHDRFKPNEALNISKGEEIKIIFNSSITSTAKFFYDYYDPNVEHIISIDLSHFNSSLLELSEYMFYGCVSLESIDLSNFNAPLLENMNNMFFHCNSLKKIDLSDFNSSNLTNINRMFCGCVSLEYLFLNNLDFSKIEDASYLFYNVRNLKFINIIDIKYNDIFKNEINNISGFNNSNIIVNQNKDIITNENFKYFDNIIENEYECSSYIIVYYKEAIEYESGFHIDGIDSRSNVLFIYNDNNIYKVNEKLNIKENSNIKLCFKNSVTSLEKFFDSSIDNKAKNIISIDLSHFNSSLINNIDNIFSECQELLAIDFSNFYFGKIENSDNVFNNLTNLRYISLYNSKNLNYTNTSELMNYISCMSK